MELATDIFQLRQGECLLEVGKQFSFFKADMRIDEVGQAGEFFLHPLFLHSLKAIDEGCDDPVIFPGTLNGFVSYVPKEDFFLFPEMDAHVCILEIKNIILYPPWIHAPLKALPYLPAEQEREVVVF